VTTAPEVLHKQGYYTGACGRYFHLDGVNNPESSTGQVYEKYQLKTWKNRVDFLDVSNHAADGPEGAKLVPAVG
jgi:N-sulfoglucosamine sulfohydrolase